ncbi:MAG: AtzH-like domain-containing protein, partial [Verrucomicrobiota bacterium]
MPEINAPAIVAELATLHDAYERALAAHDVPALTAFFWDSPHTVRYGVNEHLYGAEALAAYRNSAPPVFTDRALVRRSILVLGDDMASIMSELSQKIFGQPRHSRQSQVWVRFPGLGWKIVSAHVSNALTTPSASAPAFDAYV